MGYTEQFLNAPLITQIIIATTNVLYLIFWLVALKKDFLISAFIVSVFVVAANYMVIMFFSGIDVVTFLTIYILPAALTFIILFSLFKLLGSTFKKSLSISQVKIPHTKGVTIVNTIKGVSIQGAPGSGKTISGAGWILDSFGKKSVPGLVYDYKNLELTEIVMWFYRNADLPVHVFHPSDPSRSCNINCFDPAILNKREDFMIMAKTLTDNLIDDDSKSPFFKNAAEGAIAGVLIRLKEDFPEYCSFPYLTAIFLEKSIDELIEFLEGNPNSKRQAGTFLDSAGARDQMAGVKGNLSNAFRAFDLPNVFYTTMKNDFELEINNKKTPGLVVLVNSPNYDEVYQPLLAVTAQAIILKMSKRNREFAYLMFDEAPTLKLSRMPRIPSTMRSFNIATIYMLQDKIQAANQLGVNKMKEVLANLSTLFFGKTNDPETAKFFEAYFEQVKVKQRSFSTKEGLFMESQDRRVSVSERDEKKHKSYEMFKRGTGQFFIIDDKGNSHDVAIKKPKIEIEPFKKTRAISVLEINSNYDRILSIAKKL
ncbi:hypothetical protein MTsPCn9_34190 [Croceitalea sp. MTPC9]|uniref:type IV secretory system conjugative DNA transfer family protein n=1 Tax=unclassified Croceitalea TaxID=2632280 RepID=UPI002B36F22F|nr:hypothetical protein MTsPCn6_34760 [Croceitalea sp. MTPC6]GMN18479.1 hypothetical protein MTsPCn9_34190 [Croceitalea sp. MTPC9]